MMKKRAISILMTTCLLFGLAACGGPPPGEETTATTSAKTEVKKGEKVYITEGAIPDPATFIANQHSEAGTGNFGDLAYEGLMRYQRGTDDIQMQLAESYTNEGNKTIFKLRPDVKYNDGEPFTSKDIWAFYAINPNTPVEYLESVETPDDFTVEFVWREPAPSEQLRTMLITREIHHARCPYHIYGKYADELSNLWAQLPDLTQKQIDEGVKAPWGKDRTADPKTAAKIDDVYKQYTHHEEKEHYVIGTGPYVNVLGHTMNEATLIPNKYYWNKDVRLFDKVIIKKTTGETKANMMMNEDIYAMDGTLPKDMTEKVLSSNKNVIYYPMKDPACMGVYFNTKSERVPLDKKEFRQALNYIVDREAIRDIGSYQSDTNPYSTTVIPPSMLEKYLSPEVIDKMRNYSTDHDKAAELLESIGCTKKGDEWLSPEGKPMKMVVGIDKGWYVATLIAPALANQFKKFGIDCEVKAMDGSMYGKAADDEHQFDMSFDWMNIAWTFSHPFFSLSEFFDAGNGMFKKMNFPFDENRKLSTLELEDWDGNKFNPWAWTQGMLRESDENVNKDHYERMIWATNENAFGINFFQNTTGYWENMKYVSGLPMLDKLTDDRWMPIAETEEEDIQVRNLNIGQSGYIRKMWMLQPPEDKEEGK
ncbi:hypothetical protein INP51_01820 [Blautia liquoris]|uniref:Solute-binding protein family 5 domain-containing protein n=1 Tax=Blautia liquoris TaxID=2779518 RepID=A0A7M2RHX9_9FIRM|nr:ABC transporter substrate-binding protein [Blautia liquoris]QOV19738.1 hypothetical protein INP51_01820 [Blautia liquoris]